jgi:anionic cell wall polymer biosynthesis LytR-Cps2A-Psr (LCP) family protein
MNLNNVTVVNHLLGGVTVSVEDDFSQWDSQMVPGAIVKLSDDQAELFLHSRMSVGDGKNTSRMRRHREYLESAITELKQKMKSSASFSKKFLDGVIDVSHTDIAYGKIINELNLAYGYELLPIETLEGTHSIDEDGYVTFILDNGTVQRWITNRYYEPNT